MGRRSRKRRPPAEPRPSRTEARNEAARADLVPLAPGERPRAIVAGAAVAGALGLGNLVAYAAGVEVQGEAPNLGGIIGFSGLMLAAAVGMWQMKYWAVLGFQALLALILLTFFMFLLRASSVRGFVVAVAVIAVAGLLFYRLVKAMARIQMPQRRVQ